MCVCVCAITGTHAVTELGLMYIYPPALDSLLSVEDPTSSHLLSSEENDAYLIDGLLGFVSSPSVSSGGSAISHYPLVYHGVQSSNCETSDVLTSYLPATTTTTTTASDCHGNVDPTGGWLLNSFPVDSYYHMSTSPDGGGGGGFEERYQAITSLTQTDIYPSKRIHTSKNVQVAQQDSDDDGYFSDAPHRKSRHSKYLDDVS